MNFADRILVLDVCLMCEASLTTEGVLSRDQELTHPVT